MGGQWRNSARWVVAGWTRDETGLGAVLAVSLHRRTVP